MLSRLWKRRESASVTSPSITADQVREKYESFRELLALNTECLEVIVDLQEDLQFIPPRRDVVERRVSAIFDRADAIVQALERLTGFPQERLHEALASQRNEVERHIAALQELATPRLAVWTYEIGMSDVEEAGGKAAALGEVKSKLDLPVPSGYVVTTDAYRQFCGIPCWTTIRDAIREIEPGDLDRIRRVSRDLQELVMATPLPRAVEVAIVDRARALASAGQGMAVRSSAVGEGPEGGARTCAGQFLSLINVPVSGVVDAYKKVIASRFGERAIAYRLATGLLEVESAMAVLVLPVIQARASGVMYTRDPSNPRSKELWITATGGLGLDIASGKSPADMFIVSRRRKHPILETHIATKLESIVVAGDSSLEWRPVEAAASQEPSLDEATAKTLAEYGVRLEDYFKTPQDVEWAVDDSGQVWILQTRPLTIVESGRSASKVKADTEPVASGGRTVYPGRVSGTAHIVEDAHALADTPKGSVLFLRRASPEIVQVFPRIQGLVAEWGNVAGHAAALLREFKVPSVFLMDGALEKVRDGDPISLDSIQAAVYLGELFPRRHLEASEALLERNTAGDPISRNILTLHLLDPSAQNFRPSGCKSTHDVLRYCHEKSVEAMFTVNDIAVERGRHAVKNLKTDLPLHLTVLDLGGGLRMESPEAKDVDPSEIISLPFQALWKGISHPEVSWKREMPASLSDFASVMASSLKPQDYPSRPLGQQSYLLAAEEYMNLNTRLAYHFSLVDASLTELPSKNYIAFRFAGGGATKYRRTLRAVFVERCLAHHGFLVDRRGDLVNAWLKKAPAPQTFDALDILGRLLASTAQLDMYMTSQEVMSWYVQQFIEGNYRFGRAPTAAAEEETAPRS